MKECARLPCVPVQIQQSGNMDVLSHPLFTNQKNIICYIKTLNQNAHYISLFVSNKLAVPSSRFPLLRFDVVSFQLLLNAYRDAVVDILDYDSIGPDDAPFAYHR
jgi:hypothetical protein